MREHVFGKGTGYVGVFGAILGLAVTLTAMIAPDTPPTQTLGSSSLVPYN